MNSKEQEEAYSKFSKLKCGALFMSMGTGKTKVALELARLKLKENKVKNILYIAPASIIAKGDIEDERKRWTPDIEPKVISCEGIGGSDKIYEEALNICKESKTFCIVDESLKIKNIWAKRTKRILELGKLAEYRLILNGTPLTKNVMDIWSQMEFLSPKILKMTYKQYKDTFCIYDTKGKFKGIPKGFTNIPYLVSLIEPYIYQAELDIESKKHFKVFHYYINKKEYNRKKEELFEKYYEGDDFNFKAFSNSLQKWYTGQKEHIDLIKEVAESIHEGVIVFVKYLDNIPEGSMAITGSTKKRKEIIQNFKDKKFNVLYITYGCGSYGLNLQFCNNMIFADHTWDYAQRVQAEARIYRKGTKQDVIYYDLYCDNCGLEEMIIANQGKKSNRLGEVKDTIRKLKNRKDEMKKFFLEKC